MRRIVVGLAVVLAMAGDADPSLANQYDIQYAEQDLKSGNLSGALGWINSAISDDPDYGAAYVVRASIWMQASQFQKAVDDYSQAIAHGLDHSPYVFTMRGDAHGDAGDNAAAIADFEQALKLNPAYWPALASRGVTRVDTGDAPGALADFDRVLAANVSDFKETLGTKALMEISRKGPPGRGTETLSITTPATVVLGMSYQARGKLRFLEGAYPPALADFDAA